MAPKSCDFIPDAFKKNRMKREEKWWVEEGETPIYASVHTNIGSYRRYNDILSALLRTHRYRYVHRRFAFARYVRAPVGLLVLDRTRGDCPTPTSFPGLRMISR